MIVLGVEPGNQEVIDLCRSINFCDYLLQINETRLGCNKNIGSTLLRAFNFADYVIMVEDDILLAQDALLYFEQMKCCKSDDTGYITSYNRTTEPTDMLYNVKKRRHFTPWGWATWRDKFRYFYEKGCWNEAQISWDCFVNKDFYELYPVLGRSQNIGGEMGEYCPGPEWHRENQWCPYWADKKLETKEFTCDWNSQNQGLTTVVKPSKR